MTENCVMCSRKLKEGSDFTDPLEKVKGNICHRCFLRRAQEKGSLTMSLSIGSGKSNPNVSKLGEMAAYLTFADEEKLKELREECIRAAKRNPNIEEGSLTRMLRVVDAALNREE